MNNTIHLQGLGQTFAKPASEFVIGDFSVWNNGYSSEIIGVTPKGKKFLTWQVKTSDGKLWDRVVKADRLVAWSAKPWR